MAGDGTLVPDWLRAAVSVVLRILRNTCGLTKGSRGFPQPGDPAGYAERGGGRGSLHHTGRRAGWENEGNNGTMKCLVISRHHPESCGNWRHSYPAPSLKDGGKRGIILSLLVADAPVKSQDYVNIIKRAKMGVTNLQSQSENGRNKMCKI